MENTCDMDDRLSRLLVGLLWTALLIGLYKNGSTIPDYPKVEQHAASLLSCVLLTWYGFGQPTIRIDHYWNTNMSAVRCTYLLMISQHQFLEIRALMFFMRKLCCLQVILACWHVGPDESQISFIDRFVHSLILIQVMSSEQDFTLEELKCYDRIMFI